VPGERRGLVDERVVQLAGAGTGGQPERDAEGLAPRPPGAQPAGGRPPDAPLELGLAGVEGVAEGRVPRELVARDRVQLEQPPQERPRVVAREVMSSGPTVSRAASASCSASSTRPFSSRSWASCVNLRSLLRRLFASSCW